MLIINKFSEVPIWEQLIRGIEREILCGFLQEGKQIYSIRELSASLDVNPNTIQKAYLELARRGEIIASPGSGYYVSDGALEAVRLRETEKLKDITEIARELKRAGLPEEQVHMAIKRAYQTEEGENQA